jgi:hypothetical protein
LFQRNKIRKVFKLWNCAFFPLWEKLNFELKQGKERLKSQLGTSQIQQTKPANNKIFIIYKSS